MTWSNRERMGDRVGERVTEQCKLKWDGMVPPTRIERATRGLGNRPGQFFKMLGVSNGFPVLTAKTEVAPVGWTECVRS